MKSVGKKRDKRTAAKRVKREEESCGSAGQADFVDHQADFMGEKKLEMGASSDENVSRDEIVTASPTPTAEQEGLDTLPYGQETKTTKIPLIVALVVLVVLVSALWYLCISSAFMPNNTHVVSSEDRIAEGKSKKFFPRSQGAADQSLTSPDLKTAIHTSTSAVTPFLLQTEARVAAVQPDGNIAGDKNGAWKKTEKGEDKKHAEQIAGELVPMIWQMPPEELRTRIFIFEADPIATLHLDEIDLASTDFNWVKSIFGNIDEYGATRFPSTSTPVLPSSGFLQAQRAQPPLGQFWNAPRVVPFTPPGPVPPLHPRPIPGAVPLGQPNFAGPGAPVPHPQPHGPGAAPLVQQNYPGLAPPPGPSPPLNPQLLGLGAVPPVQPKFPGLAAPPGPVPPLYPQPLGLGAARLVQPTSPGSPLPQHTRQSSISSARVRGAWQAMTDGLKRAQHPLREQAGAALHNLVVGDVELPGAAVQENGRQKIPITYSDPRAGGHVSNHLVLAQQIGKGSFGTAYVSSCISDPNQECVTKQIKVQNGESEMTLLASEIFIQHVLWQWFELKKGSRVSPIFTNAAFEAESFNAKHAARMVTTNCIPRVDSAFFESDGQGGSVYLVMERVDKPDGGATVISKLEAFYNCLWILFNIGATHSDFKADNLGLSLHKPGQKQEPRLLDFGLSTLWVPNPQASLAEPVMLPVVGYLKNIPGGIFGTMPMLHPNGLRIRSCYDTTQQFREDQALLNSQLILGLQSDLYALSTTWVGLLSAQGMSARDVSGVFPFLGVICGYQIDDTLREQIFRHFGGTNGVLRLLRDDPFDRCRPDANDPDCHPKSGKAMMFADLCKPEQFGLTKSDVDRLDHMMIGGRLPRCYRGYTTTQLQGILSYLSSQTPLMTREGFEIIATGLRVTAGRAPSPPFSLVMYDADAEMQKGGSGPPIGRLMPQGQPTPSGQEGLPVAPVAPQAPPVRPSGQGGFPVAPVAPQAPPVQPIAPVAPVPQPVFGAPGVPFGPGDQFIYPSASQNTPPMGGPPGQPAAFLYPNQHVGQALARAHFPGGPLLAPPSPAAPAPQGQSPHGYYDNNHPGAPAHQQQPQQMGTPASSRPALDAHYDDVLHGLLDIKSGHSPGR
ncbi:unnamed protein product [Amoebophrya sp. A25]|nr:unnamed protein product [Amoebophrya sp. A25]|eukprot:GSA25T00024637001.1